MTKVKIRIRPLKLSEMDGYWNLNKAQLAKKVMDKLNNEVNPMSVELDLQIRSQGSYDRHRIGILGDIPDSVQLIDFFNYLDKRWALFPEQTTNGLKRDGNVLTARLIKYTCDFGNRSKELIPKIHSNCSARFYRAIFEI